MIKAEILDYIKSNNGVEIAPLQKRFGLTYRQAKSIVDELLSAGELSFYGGVRYDYVGREPLSQGQGAQNHTNAGNKNERGTDGEDEEDLHYWSLKCALENGYVTVSLLQRRFPIGFIRACRMVDWMESQGYISPPDGHNPRKVLITQEEFDKLYGETHCDEAIHFDPEEDELDDFFADAPDDVFDGDLDDDLDDIFYDDEDEDEEDPEQALRELEEYANATFDAKFAELEAEFNAEGQKLIDVLNLIIEQKKKPVSAEVVPPHPSWQNEDEFVKEVLDRLERLILSDRKMGQRGAVKKAETCLEGVRDTHDRKMAEVYERLVYELKNTSEYLYRQLKKQFAG